MSMISKPRNLKGELLATEPWVQQKIADATAGVSSIAGKSGDITIDSNFTMSEQGQLGLAESISVNEITYNGNVANAEGGLIVLGTGKKLDSDIKVVHSIAEATGDLTLGSNLKLVGGTEINLADVVTLAAEMDKGITFSMADGMVSNGKDVTVKDAKIKIDTATNANIQYGENDLFMDGLINEELLPELGKTYTAGRFISIDGNNQIAVKGTVSSNIETFDYGATDVVEKTTGGYSIKGGEGAIPSSLVLTSNAAVLTRDFTGGQNKVTVGEDGISLTTNGNSGETTFKVLYGGGLTYKGNRENTAGGLIVLDENGNIPSTAGVVSFAGKKGAITVSNDLSVSESGQLGVSSGVFVRQVGTGSLTLSGYSGFNLGAPLSVDGAVSATVMTAGSFNVGTAQMNAAGGIPTLDSNGLIKEEQLPPLAITKVLPVEADGSDLLALLKKAATDAGLTQVENSELIMIYRPEGEESNSSSTSLNDDYYDSVCGEYFVLNEVTVANMQLTDVKKTYSRSSVNITVNGKTPVDGNITVNLDDIADLTSEQARVLKTIQTGGSGENLTVEVDGIGLATKKDLQDAQELTPTCMKFSVPLTGTIPYGDSAVSVTRTVEGTNYKFTFTTQIPVTDPVGVVLELIRATLIDSTNSTRANVILDATSSYDGESGKTTLVVEADFGDGYVATGKSFDFVILVGRCLTVDTQGQGG